MANSGDHRDPYERIVAKPFGYHMNRWHSTTEREVPGLFQHFRKQSGPQIVQMPNPIESWLKIWKVSTSQGGIPGGHQWHLSFFFSSSGSKSCNCPEYQF
jgi:hypothetical protein